MAEPDLLLMREAPQVVNRQPFVDAAEYLERTMVTQAVMGEGPNPLEMLGAQFLALVDVEPLKPGTRTGDVPEILVKVVKALRANQG